MTVTPSSLWRLAGEAYAPLYSGLPGGEGQLTPHGWLALSGEPVADLNLAYVDDGPAAEDQLRTFATAIAGRQLPAIVLLAPAAAERLDPVARGLGLQPVGGLPLMVHRPEGPAAGAGDAGRYRVDRVTTPEELAVVHRLLASAFGLPLDSVSRAFGSQVLNAAGLAVFLARREGRPVSTAMTTGAGEVVGIWSMATAPAQQRQGAGRATLAAVMAHHRQRGAGLFYLGATPAGKPLYEAAGFRTVEETPIWVAGRSAQFPGH